MYMLPSQVNQIKTLLTTNQKKWLKLSERQLVDMVTKLLLGPSKEGQPIKLRNTVFVGLRVMMDEKDWLKMMKRYQRIQ